MSLDLLFFPAFMDRRRTLSIKAQEAKMVGGTASAAALRENT